MLAPREFDVATRPWLGRGAMELPNRSINETIATTRTPRITQNGHQRKMALIDCMQKIQSGRAARVYSFVQAAIGPGVFVREINYKDAPFMQH